MRHFLSASVVLITLRSYGRKIIMGQFASEIRLLSLEMKRCDEFRTRIHSSEAFDLKDLQLGKSQENIRTNTLPEQ